MSQRSLSVPQYVQLRAGAPGKLYRLARSRGMPGGASPHVPRQVDAIASLPLRAAVRAGLEERPMTRLARDFSWHLAAFFLVVAGLLALAPFAWWQTRSLDESARAQIPAGGLPNQAAAEPQIAPLRPLVADEIRLDPSVTETPALPSTAAPTVNQHLMGDASGDLRLSAVTNKAI